MTDINTHPMLSKSKRNVFISYAWEDDLHVEWVKVFAEQINNAGANCILDQHLKYGSSLRLFMDMNIKAADVVLMVMTPQYKSKAEILNGGVGYEYNIITKDLFKTIHKNEKYIGILRSGNHSESVPEFLDDFKYVDLRDGKNYDQNFSLLLKQILTTPLKHPEMKSKTLSAEVQYEDASALIANMEINAHKYFEEIFPINRHSVDVQEGKRIFNDWQEKVIEYSEIFKNIFGPDKMEKYKRYKEDFKTKTFRNNLWTVGSALKTPDPDLMQYKGNFRDAKANDIFTIVNDIFTETHNYVKNHGSQLVYSDIASEEELLFDFLNEEGMSMKQIIGFGIRSEILHRYYPAHFPIMTQQNLWAMYFICESASEFIKIEQRVRAGTMRVSSNWQYPYARFTFIMNALAEMLKNWLKEFEIEWNDAYRFGYVNLFLANIHTKHKPDIKILHEWA